MAARAIPRAFSVAAHMRNVASCKVTRSAAVAPESTGPGY